METKYKIHFFYIISILLIIIILISTLKLSSNSDLIKYISFASTITSLLLALLAIVYAYFSNATFSKNITMINEVSSELKQNTSNLTKISEVIEKDIKNLPIAIDGMGKKVESIPNLIRELTSKEPTKDKKNSNDSEINISPELINQFNKSSSFAGLLCLYAIKIAFEKKVPFNYVSFSKKTNYVSEEYAHGYLTATFSLGIFDYNSSKEVWNITELNKNFQDTVKQELLKRGKEIKEDLEKEDIEFEYLEDIKATEDYFDE
jgi:LPS O-antigen subunit length determinant protein (WzzB/FepE family)